MNKEFLEKLLERLIKNKEMIIFLIAVGILLIFLTNIFSTPVSKSNDKEITNDSEEMNYEQNIENKLLKLLKQVDPTGDVSVMITFEDSYEYMLATETSKETRNEESQGQRILKEEQVDNKVVLLQQNDGSKPFIVKKVHPKVRGVAIVSKGASDKNVYIGLIKLTSRVLGITPNKVEVYVK
ncbi:hypothetical protein ACAG39_00710 [Caldicellulosiruptoraceae bacterium PP1]